MLGPKFGSELNLSIKKKSRDNCKARKTSKFQDTSIINSETAQVN